MLYNIAAPRGAGSLSRAKSRRILVSLLITDTFKKITNQEIDILWAN